MKNILLDHQKDLGNEDFLSADIICDKVGWKLPYEMLSFVQSISQDSSLTDEDRILLVYERICKAYNYDDNILSYLQKYDDDKFGLPDFYALNPSKEWEENREQHNRRVCYELSRMLARALTELFKKNSNYNTCILYDQDLTHYFVGLSSDKYILTLDLDDFYGIKDLTRIKTMLTAEGITILEDKENTFTEALKRYNEGRNQYAIKGFEEVEESEPANQQSNEPEDILFFRNAIEVLKEKYDLDSQGIFEYMKEIIDVRLGPEKRKKIWKKLTNESSQETRYTRCLVLEVDDTQYLIDTDQKAIRPFDEKTEIGAEDSIFIPYKQLTPRSWDEYYDGK